MHIQVSGKKIDVGDALRTHVTDRLEAGVAKYFDRPVDAHVTFSREGHSFRSDCSVHLASGISLQTQADANEIYASFDSAAERLEKRLRRYKRRLRNHHDSHNGDPFPALDAPYHVLDGGSEDDEAPESDDPVIVAETKTSVRTLTVGQAVTQLELVDGPALVFKNAGNDRINVVYRRADGNIGWVDPA